MPQEASEIRLWKNTCKNPAFLASSGAVKKWWAGKMLVSNARIKGLWKTFSGELHTS